MYLVLVDQKKKKMGETCVTYGGRIMYTHLEGLCIQGKKIKISFEGTGWEWWLDLSGSG
jgi:hypothetical protein